MMRLDERLLRALPRRPSGRIYEQRFTPEAGGLFGIDEPMPEGFLADLRAAWAPGGYLCGSACARFAYGMSCGNIFTLLEAFSGEPRGIIIAGLDPAVVCALELLLDSVTRHADPVGFARELLGDGEAAWRRIEERVLARREALGLALPGPGDRERLWEGLQRLSEEGVFADEAGAARRIEEWLAATPEPGESPLFWSHFFRVYQKLHALAASGRVAVIQASLFDPALLAAIADLPGFADSVNVIYLSNLADSEARRILFASGRAKLGLSDEEEIDLDSTPEFVEALNATLRRLRTLASGRGAVFVHSSESRERMLLAEADVPQHSPADFFLQIDLNRMAFALFEAPVEEDETEPPPGPWRGARAFRDAARALFGAAVRRDPEAATAAAMRVVRELSISPLVTDGDPAYLAFRVAELAEALLMARRNGAAAPDALRPLEEAVRTGIGRLAGLREESLQAAGGAWELFLPAHAFASGGRLLADPALAAAGRWLAAAGLELRGDQDESFARRAEAVFRLLRCDIHDPQPGVAAAVRRGVARLLAEVLPSREVSVAGGAAGQGYAAYAQTDDAAYDNTRLALLFHGLRAEELDPIRAVFLIRRSAGVAASKEVAR